MHYFKLGAIALATSFAALASQTAAAAETLRLAHGLAENHPVHLAMVKFAELTKQKSNGELEVKIFANGTLGGERKRWSRCRTACWK